MIQYYLMVSGISYTSSNVLQRSVPYNVKPWYSYSELYNFISSYTSLFFLLHFYRMVNELYYTVVKHFVRNFGFLFFLYAESSNCCSFHYGYHYEYLEGRTTGTLRGSRIYSEPSLAQPHHKCWGRRQTSKYASNVLHKNIW